MGQNGHAWGMRKQLTEDEIYQRLHDALRAIGDDEGATEYGNNTLRAARKMLNALQIAMIAHQDQIYVEWPIPGVDPRPPKDP